MKVDYQQYLASREWRLKRKEVIELRGGICERCASHPIEHVHHLTYTNLGQESPLDLMGVCYPCHEYLSAERDDDPALEIIQRIIAKHRLFPAKAVLGMENNPWPPVISGYPKHNPTVLVVLVPEGEDTCGQPKMPMGPGVIGVFYWAQVKRE